MLFYLLLPSTYFYLPVPTYLSVSECLLPYPYSPIPTPLSLPTYRGSSTSSSLGLLTHSVCCSTDSTEPSDLDRLIGLLGSVLSCSVLRSLCILLFLLFSLLLFSLLRFSFFLLVFFGLLGLDLRSLRSYSVSPSGFLLSSCSYLLLYLPSSIFYLLSLLLQ